MPHVTIKLYPGKTQEQKNRLSDAIVESIQSIMGSSNKSISIAFEEVDPTVWQAEVYDPDIVAQQDLLTKRPGYGSLAASESAS